MGLDHQLQPVNPELGAGLHVHYFLPGVIGKVGGGVLEVELIGGDTLRQGLLTSLPLASSCSS